MVPIVGGEVGEPASWLVKPERSIKYFATRIHGLTNDDVADAHVDVGVLRRHLGAWECPEVFDTLKLARRLLPNQVSYTLGALTEAFTLAEGLPDGLSPHRAIYDVLGTARLFVRLATLPDTRPLSLEELRGDAPR